MNDTSGTLICKRCGWKSEIPGEQFIVGDEGRLHRVPDEMISGHPPDRCCSPFWTGQALYWASGCDPDLPPIRVFFQEVAEIQSATFALLQNEWVKESEPKVTVVMVTVDQQSIYPQHVEIYGKEILSHPISVGVETLTPEEAWPVLEVA